MAIWGKNPGKFGPINRSEYISEASPTSQNIIIGRPTIKGIFTFPLITCINHIMAKKNKKIFEPYIYPSPNNVHARQFRVKGRKDK